MEILHLKLKKDLLKLALDYNKDKSEEEFTKWVTQRIDSYITDKNISFSFTKECKVRDCERCNARLWDTGERCTHKIKEGNYCKKHNTMLEREGVLRFGDIRDKRPSHDLIKLKNGDIERLHWIDPNPLNQLQSVLNQQQKKVILSTPTLIVD
tara:strand:+ start:354 stop:812 length:459 start_codon:yes stop_codon:yes gene_type:complete